MTETSNYVELRINRVRINCSRPVTQSATVFSLTDLPYWFKTDFILKILGISGIQIQKKLYEMRDGRTRKIQKRDLIYVILVMRNVFLVG